MTLFKQDSIIDILNVPTFLGGGGPAFSQNSSDYLARVLICLKSCSEKFHKFYRKETLMKSFLEASAFLRRTPIQMVSQSSGEHF